MRRKRNGVNAKKNSLLPPNQFVIADCGGTPKTDLSYHSGLYLNTNTKVTK